MAQLNAYLTFNGNCREAMTFYKDCLGGELTFQTVGESPLSFTMQKRMKDCIVHAMLCTDALVLMATDMVGEQGLIKGNSISLALHGNCEREIKEYFSKLSAGGTVHHSLEDNFEGALMGTLTDKFGHHWILNYNTRTQP